MKSTLLPLFAGTALALLATLHAGPRDDLWQQVDQAETDRLPQTAIAALEPIIEQTLADGSHAEAIKAIAKKTFLESQIAGTPAPENIRRYQEQIATLPSELHPVLETILAHQYWTYFQQNRWRFMQRTQTASAPSGDFETWDLARILAEIDRHFTAALANPDALQSIPIESYSDLLEKGSVPDGYRPTLYDFLVHEALSFYQTGEQAAITAEKPFTLEASSPVFDDADAFLNWQPETDSDSPKLKAIQLYQDLLRFHQKDRDRSAFLDADLARLVYARNSAVGPDRDSRYQAALERFIKATAKHEISSQARAKLAQLHLERDDSVTAHQLASLGLENFPDSIGATECFNLIQTIEAPSAYLSTEAIWNAPWPTLDITYRNITKVYFRAIPIDFEKTIRKGTYDPHPFQHNKLLAATPTLEWSSVLPTTSDYRERTESLPAPTSLAPGYYSILASYRPDFSETDNQISHTPVWVSKLALVTLSENAENKLPSVGGFVLDAQTGRPLADARIRSWIQNRQGIFKAGPKTKTDADGRFLVEMSESNSRYILLADHDGQTISSDPNAYHYLSRVPTDEEASQQKTVFFTDRVLYRPGQTVHYKGICIQSDQAKQSYATLPNRTVKVAFYDSNRRELATATHRTNDYGSFSGSFTAPNNGLTGWMNIRTVDSPSGSASFNVEEYKRPKFQAELLPPEQAPKLGETVALTGKATAYNGSAIGGAKVQWRVERTARAPIWCWWWRPQSSQAIAHGEAETAADGTFQIEFTADPNRSISPDQEPVFVYSIHADVTDTTGETRSASSTTRAGYTALQANLTLDSWQTADSPVTVSINTSSLDDTPQSARGTLSVYSLSQPDSAQRSPLASRSYRWNPTANKPTFDPGNPSSWEKATLLSSHSFATAASGSTEIPLNLPAGPYRLELSSQDRFGQPVTALATINVVDPNAASFTTKIPQFLDAPTFTREPGETFTALWGTGYSSGQAYIEILSAGRTLKSYWTDPKSTQERIEFPISEDLRGGLTLRTTFVRENRAYIASKRIEVPWTNKQLAVKWESFRSKLLPGQAETWTATITGPDAEKTAAELVAGLYDASLDQYRKHSWLQNFEREFRHEPHYSLGSFANQLKSFNQLVGNWEYDFRPVDWTYRTLPYWLKAHTAGGQEIYELSPFSIAASADSGYRTVSSLSGSRARNEMAYSPNALASVMQDRDATAKLEMSVQPAPPPDLNQVAARTNLNETAFFYPHLLSDENGVVKIQFTIPEALTQWRFFGFAHDQQLRSGFLTDTVVTAKDLMVEPNPPRFLREGDEIEFTVKVSNQSDKTQTGRVRLTFADAATLASADQSLNNLAPEQPFEIPAKQSRAYSWRISVPDGAGVLTYKAVGASSTLSDGEEGYLPVLSKRILVTESLPLPIRGKTTKDYTFDKLLASANSDTLRSQSLTVQMVSQPAWYALQALPYLMEFPHECSEQLFSRYYANTLAAHIANSDPKIRRIFDLWKNTPALYSPLEKNQDLKSVLIEETPWLRQAKSESENRRQVGQLFDSNRLADESARALQKLAERQLNDGRWSWFPGGRASDYITLHIVTGFGRLRHLGVDVDPAPAVRSLAALDAWMHDRYDDIQKDYGKPEDYVLGHTDALYLYARSFFLEDRPIANNHRKALAFFLEQARARWTKVGSRQSEAHLALALQRFGDEETPVAILKSLKERSITSEEFGMYWADTGNSWWWYHAPVETQALMIEAFAEVAQDTQAVEDLKVWLLKQKQTQNWKTTKATADAVYALLLQGSNLLASDALVAVSLVAVSLGGQTIVPENVEAGTGFYQKTFIRQEIQPAQGHITVTKTDDGVSWGSAHWQYLEDVSKITPHEGTPLTLKKTLFVKENTARGPVLKPVAGPLSVGDELVVRLELRSDRDMEYLHLKDQRGSGTEPVNVLSGYRYQDGLGYYESTRDTASHFFIERLDKGTYVFEYSTRVQLKGVYQSGIAEIQCMYAPEFNSHSASVTLTVE